jgi:hypothetical protein
VRRLLRLVRWVRECRQLFGATPRVDEWWRALAERNYTLRCEPLEPGPSVPVDVARELRRDAIRKLGDDDIDRVLAGIERGYRQDSRTLGERS